MPEHIEVRQCGECDFVGFSIELQEHLAQTGHKRLGFFQEITREIFGPAEWIPPKGSIQQVNITKEIPILCSGCGNGSGLEYWFYCENCLDRVAYNSYRSARLANRSIVVKMLLGLWVSVVEKHNYNRWWCIDFAEAFHSKRTFKLFLSRRCDRCGQKINEESYNYGGGG